MLVSGNEFLDPQISAVVCISCSVVLSPHDHRVCVQIGGEIRDGRDEEEETNPRAALIVYSGRWKWGKTGEKGVDSHGSNNTRRVQLREERMRRKGAKGSQGMLCLLLCFMCYQKIDSLCLPSNDFLAALSPSPILFLIPSETSSGSPFAPQHPFPWVKDMIPVTYTSGEEEGVGGGERKESRKSSEWKEGNGMKQKWWSTMRKADAMLLFSRFVHRLSDCLSGFMCCESHFLLPLTLFTQTCKRYSYKLWSLTLQQTYWLTLEPDFEATKHATESMTRATLYPVSFSLLLAVCSYVSLCLLRPTKSTWKRIRWHSILLLPVRQRDRTEPGSHMHCS